MIPRTPIQLCYWGLMLYTALQFKLVYFPKLTLQGLHECMVHVDEAHCGEIFEEWYEKEAMIKLSQS